MITKLKEIEDELKKLNIEIGNIYDLLKIKTPYPTIIPLLLDLLKESGDNYNFKEGIVRALAVKEAKGVANSILLTEYNRTPKEISFYRWTIGNTMDVIVMPNDLNDILKIVQDKANGSSRQMFVSALGKLKSENSENTLINLLSDEDVALHALSALGKLKSHKAKDKIKTLLSHSNSIIKKKAEKVLKKIS